MNEKSFPSRDADYCHVGYGVSIETKLLLNLKIAKRKSLIKAPGSKAINKIQKSYSSFHYI